MSQPADLVRYRANLQKEIDGAALYRALAAAETRPEIAEVYRRLATTEERHADLWRAKLRAAGVAPPDPRPSARTRVLGWLARRFGVESVIPLLVGMEAGDGHAYDVQPEARAAGLPADERSHGRIFRHLLTGNPGGYTGEALAQLEGRHRATGGNALRAAVLGANDGLVSNFSLVMGVAGADLAPATILLTGLAGLLAGAISMALGEWLSVQSSRELYQYQLDVERAELEEFPDEEAEELTLIYQAKGVARDEARRLAQRLVADPATALDALAREELGIDPEGLGGSAGIAAATSFLLFATGAVVPVLPYFFLGGFTAVVLSGLLSAVALFAIGGGITLFTGRKLLYSGGRQVAFGLAAATVTFAIGRLFGIALT